MRQIAAVLLLIMGAALAQPCMAQETEAAPGPQSSLEVPPAEPAPAPALASIGVPPSVKTHLRPVSLLWLVPNIAMDQKPIWTFPLSVARGHHLKPTLIVSAITAGLVLGVDPPSGRYFQRTRTFEGFNVKFNGINTARGTYMTPTGLVAIGIARRDAYMKRTFILAGEAVLDAEIVTSVMKDIDRRLKPIEVPLHGNFNDTWLHPTNDGTIIGGIGSFPSGHTIAAVAVATVFADRYPRYKYLAYGLAALVGFSRVSVQSHHPSDVFAAFALGYSIAHYVVINSHARD